MQVLEEMEVVFLEHRECVTDRLQCICHVLLTQLFCLLLGCASSVRCSPTSVDRCQSLGLLVLFFLFSGVVVHILLLLHLEQVVSCDSNPKVGPFFLDKALEALSDHVLLINVLGQLA